MSTNISVDKQLAHRRRERQNDSSTRVDLNLAPYSNLALEGFTCEKYRSGSPPLQYLPIASLHLHQHNAAYSILQRLLPEITSILNAYQVQRQESDFAGIPLDIEFVHRILQYDAPSLQNLTVFVLAEWNDDAQDSWLQTVNDIRGLLVQKLRADQSMSRSSLESFRKNAVLHLLRRIILLLVCGVSYNQQ